ncbi:hypothetical protein CPLU01_15287 [Colletotrichum plurivorum]|uniref:Uncharacterized protein n=1 Tax=Colletotrichum plurivorum TaxID=2175906 RepID=A0A8H6JCG7_9PEZI|nr:hypothetical protein CPLU01_15287 [Colletotrichum plurivorum]
MGLALHNSSDALNILSHGPSMVTTTTTPSARPSRGAHHNGAFLRPDGSLSLSGELSDHNLPLLEIVLVANQQRRNQRHRQRQARRRHLGERAVHQWCSEEAAEGAALAALGAVRLPREDPLPAPQLRRTPSLERQGAFRDPRSSKERGQEEERDITEMYRLGMLYEDEHIRGSGFDLEGIGRPEYTIRPAKTRRRKTRQGSYEDDLQLALDLSLAELGRDESFARYLLSPDLDECPSEDSDELISDTPDLTTDSDSDSDSCSETLSLTSNSSNSQDDSHWVRPMGRHRRRCDDHRGDAWIVLGDGS